MSMFSRTSVAIKWGEDSSPNGSAKTEARDNEVWMDLFGLQSGRIWLRSAGVSPLQRQVGAQESFVGCIHVARIAHRSAMIWHSSMRVVARAALKARVLRQQLPGQPLPALGNPVKGSTWTSVGGTFMEVKCYSSAADKASRRPSHESIPTEAEKPSTTATLRKQPSLPITSRASAKPSPCLNEEIAPVSQQTSRAALESVIQEAEKELQKLLVLQALANERKQLEDLLFQKSQRNLSSAKADAGT